MPHSSIVNAADIWTDTGFDLDPECRYSFNYSEDPTSPWKDASIVCDPVNGHNTPYLRPFNFLRRAHDLNYYVLVGCLDKDGATNFAVLAHQNDPYVPPRRGRLWVFANDIRHFYFNNHGRITLTIHSQE